MTTFKHFMEEIEREANQGGPDSLDQFEDLVQYYGRRREEIKTYLGQEYCAVDAHFEHQKTLPLERRSNAFMIACRCQKCQTAKL